MRSNPQRCAVDRHRATGVRRVGLRRPASITTLYGIFGEFDPTDDNTSGEYSASPEQIPEITGALRLCPSHPLAAELRATINRGRAEAALEAAGRLFSAGTYLVGDEIGPATYYIEGEIEGCYWERQDSAGEIIDNNFVETGWRVEVTIRSSGYAFPLRRLRAVAAGRLTATRDDGPHPAMAASLCLRFRTSRGGGSVAKGAGRGLDEVEVCSLLISGFGVRVPDGAPIYLRRCKIAPPLRPILGLPRGRISSAAVRTSAIRAAAARMTLLSSQSRPRADL
jgi:hypothetical protein